MTSPDKYQFDHLGHRLIIILSHNSNFLELEIK